MLLEDAGGRQRGLEAMGGPMAKNLAQTSKRFPITLGVVRQTVEKTLHEGRISQPPNQPPLRRCKDRKRQCGMVHDGIGAAH